MGGTGIEEKREVITKRAEFIEVLDENGPSQPRDIVDELDHSRSTVTRALRELTENGLVEKRSGGYAATVAGVMAVDEYRRHEERSRAIFSSKELLESLPDPDYLPPSVLTGAQTYLTDESAPFRPLEQVTERVRNAENIRVYLPTLVNPHLLRVWHEKVTTDGADSVGIFGEELLSLLQGQYPQLLCEMGTTDGFSAFSGDGPPYTLILTTNGDTTVVSVVVYGQDSGVRGVLVNDTPSAVEWATDQFSKLRQEAREATEDIEALTGTFKEDVPKLDHVSTNSSEANHIERDGGFAGHALPLDLETQGFVRLSKEFFETRQQASPAMSWQTGFTLPEIRAGHAVDRIDDGQSLTNQLIEKLQADTNHVVLGPPGTGKSTVCMSVACEWYDSQYGPVLYRERGKGDEFTSPALLEAYLRQVDSHALVVVEDAIRGEANDIFEVMRALDNLQNVTFLLDARVKEWNDPDDFALDPRADAYRKSSIERVVIPKLDEDDCTRFVEEYQRLVDQDIDISGTELAATVHSENPERTKNTPEPAEALVVQNCLTKRTGALSAEESADALEADIEQTLQTLSEADEELIVDLAVLVNLLNAAGVPVAQEYFYALGSAEEYDRINDVISRLEGRILFNGQGKGRHATEYRTHHELWSTRFLEQSLDIFSESRAQEVFGRCVSQLLAMADDAHQREQIKRYCSGATPHLHQIESDPERWADEVAERIFSVGKSQARLARLYGETDDNTIFLPETCSPLTRLEQYIWRTEMNWKQGKLERAEYEVECLLDAAESSDNVPETEILRLRSHGHYHLGMVNAVRGDYECSAKCFDQSLSLAKETGDVQARAEARFGLANAELFEWNISEAQSHIKKIRQIARESDLPGQEASALHTQATLYIGQGNYEEGRQREKQALELAREANNKQVEPAALANLGGIKATENNFEDAESYLLEALEVYRESGFEQGTAFVYMELGNIARKQGEITEAEEYLEQALAHARNNQIQMWVAGSLSTLADLEYDRNNLAAAESYAEDVLATISEESFHQHDSSVFRTLARIELRRGNLDTAESQVQKAIASDSSDNPLTLADCDKIRANIALARGDYAAAERLAVSGLSRYDEYKIGDREADCHRILGLVALERSETEVAAEHLHKGLEKAKGSGVVRTIAELSEALAKLESELGNEEQAKTYLERANDAYTQLNNEERCSSVADIIK
jgi:tetratricopeptide (TPR) repeat protein/predicted transcriptional regulator